MVTVRWIVLINAFTYNLKILISLFFLNYDYYEILRRGTNWKESGSFMLATRRHKLRHFAEECRNRRQWGKDMDTVYLYIVFDIRRFCCWLVWMCEQAHAVHDRPMEQHPESRSLSDSSALFFTWQNASRGIKNEALQVVFHFWAEAATAVRL